MARLMQYVPRWWAARGPVRRKLLGRLVDEAENRNGPGMYCDVRTWKRFRAWLEEEKSWQG